VRYDVEVGGRPRQVTISRAGTGFAAVVEGRTFHVSAERIDSGTLSLLLQPEGGLSRIFDVTIVPDPASGQLAVHIGDATLTVGLNSRRLSSRSSISGMPGISALSPSPGGRDEDGDAAAGPQRILAPMPGKIVRVLVQSGEAVRARQPLVVVEAMKMENELRAGRAGIVAEVHAQEGLSVDAGSLLVVIQ
jgi:biotin carboxyl carrier protein